MKRIDPTVIKETKYIAAWVGILSLLMEAVFLIIARWSVAVLLGNLLSGGLAVLNFFLMGLSVQNAVAKEAQDAKNTMRVSQIYRNFLILVVCGVGVLLPVFNTWTVIIPLFFPRIAIALRPIFDKKNS